MENKLREQIKLYKAMIKAYQELRKESYFDEERLVAKIGTMKMVIEDLEEIVGGEND